MEPSRTTTIHRDKAKTTRNVIAAGIFAVVAFWLCTGHFRSDARLIMIVFAIPIALGALYFAATAWTAAAVGECPHCDLYLLGLDTGTNDAVLCGACGRYCEGKDGKLWPTPPDRVLARPSFGAELAEAARWPDGCVVCAAPATRTVAAKLTQEGPARLDKDLATRLATLGTFRLVETQTLTVQVPHCAAHDDGAALHFGVESDQLGPTIRFRSHAAMLRWNELNGTRARS